MDPTARRCAHVEHTVRPGKPWIHSLQPDGNTKLCEASPVRIARSFTRKHTHSSVGSIWLSELFYPVYAVGFSLAILLLQLALRLWAKKSSDQSTPPTPHLSVGDRFQKHLDGIGGRVIFTYRLARLFANGALVAFGGYTLSSRQYARPERNVAGLHVGLLGVYVRSISPSPLGYAETCC